MLKEYLIGRLKAKSFSGPAVETLHDSLDLLVGDGGELSPLGKILAHQTVGVLVYAALPRGIGMGK